MTDSLRSLWDRFSVFATNHLLPAILLLAAGLLAIKLVNRIIGRLMDRVNLDPAVERLIQSVVKLVLYLLLGLMVASSAGIDVTGVVALASVLTLAVSLALQDALSNILGGFTLLSTRQFSTGDLVEISGQLGTVSEVGLTYTRIITPDNKTVSIPNSSVVADKIINYTAQGTRRVEIAVQASYDSDPETVISGLLEAADLPEVLADPAPFAGLSGYGDSAIGYVLRVWCKNEDYGHVLFTVNRRVKTVFDARGVEMTYPHLNVHMDR